MLPAEIVESILDFLDLRDKPTLLSCSLVSRIWVQSSQQHLFRTTTISLHRLRRILVESPHLAPYIRTLEIINDGFSFLPVTSHSGPSPAPLPHLNLSLHTLSLANIVWNQVSEILQQLFLALLRQPTLTTIHLKSCQFPPSFHFFPAAPSLKRLTINPVDF
ncbi:hypothetical protein MSAN_00060400 [Mycena sanguinolenta]|uniref:F-box domain-containing protein n=1 Tax=Mycena sanguinolenta TaxID=230812 RepID=A0A8H6ZCJ0_9AGAR|nr:hypothetical protein MSAN_00060400 [Mycena sanguinolenta]